MSWLGGRDSNPDNVSTEGRSEVDIGAVLDLIFVGSEFFEPAALDEQVCSDPGDDKFVACAIASGTEVVISGDRHLLRVSGVASRS